MDSHELRAWQQLALNDYRIKRQRQFLVVATPGAGKTRFAAEVANDLLEEGAIDQIVIVVPSIHLKRQWAGEFAGAHIDIEYRWENKDGAFPSDMRGVAVHYAQVASQPDLMRRAVGKKRTLAILDEIHHCGDSETLAWGSSAKHAFEPARRILSLSGTPFRGDNHKIPFVNYVDGVSHPDYIYDYGRALADGVCRPVYFPRRGGNMEWRSSAGEILSASFDDEIGERQSSERLRTAVDPSGDWMREVLVDADSQIKQLREFDPKAGGIVYALDVLAANRIAGLMKEALGLDPVVAHSETDDSASDAIQRFSDSSDPWIVSVKMVSEGVDIPRLRVGVYATNVRRELFFRQVVGRLVRSQQHLDDDSSYLYIPDDPTLRNYAERIKEQRDHALKEELEDEEEGRLTGDATRQGGLFFAPISSTMIDKGVLVDGQHVDPALWEEAERLKALSVLAKGVQTAAIVELVRLIRSASQTTEILTSKVLPPRNTKSDRKKDLKRKNNKIAKQIGYRLGIEYQVVNMRANAIVGITSVTAGNATEERLEKRLEVLKSWLVKGQTS